MVYNAHYRLLSKAYMNQRIYRLTYTYCISFSVLSALLCLCGYINNLTLYVHTRMTIETGDYIIYLMFPFIH